MFFWFTWLKCGSTRRTYNWRSNSFLKLVKDLMALKLGGKLFYKCAHCNRSYVSKIGTGLRRIQFVITIPKSIVRAEGLK